MKLFDTFLIGSGPADLDLLECRLREVGGLGLIYRFVVVEGDVTFSGLPKPMYFPAAQRRFDQWRDLIRYVPIHPTVNQPGKQPGDAWAREHASRMGVLVGLSDAEQQDIVIHGDADELLSAKALADIISLQYFRPTPYKLEMRHFSFAVDWQQPWMWRAPTVATMGDVYRFGPTKLREDDWPVIPGDAGWHLSWLGGLDSVEVKARSFSHVEVADMVCDNAERFYVRGQWTGGDPDGVFHEWEDMRAVEVDDTWPKWIAQRECPSSWFRPREVR